MASIKLPRPGRLSDKWLFIVFCLGLIPSLAKSTHALGLTDDVYNRPRHFPALDCTASNAIILEPTDAIYEVVNLPDVHIFCFRPGNYPTLYLNTSGTPNQARFIVPVTEQAVIARPWEQPADELVTFSGLSIEAKHWIVAGVRFASDDSSAVDFFVGAEQNRLDTVLVEGISEANPAGYGGSLIKFNEGSRNNTLQYSVVRRSPRSPFTDFHCIVVRDSQFNTISYNEIYDCAGDGIQLLWLPQFDAELSWDNRGNEITHNEIYVSPDYYVNCESGLPDPAGRCACAENGLDIKLTSIEPVPESEQVNIAHNTFSGFRQTAPTCGGTGDLAAPAVLLHHQFTQQVILQSNLIFRSSAGIQLFDRGSGGPDNIEIFNNILVDIQADAAIKLVSGREHHITYNTITLNINNDTPRRSIHLLKSVESATISHNLIFSAQRRYRGLFEPNNHNPANFTINNNAYVRNASPIEGISAANDYQFEAEPLTNFLPHCFTQHQHTNPTELCLPYVIPNLTASTLDLGLPLSPTPLLDFFAQFRDTTPDLGAIEFDY